MRRAVRALLLGGVLLPGFSGCGGVLSEAVRQEAVPYEDFAALREGGERFQGATVILGGELIETRNLPDQTILLVLERPLGPGQRPRGDAPVGGRFMVRFGAYLDPVLFEAGRSVTVAGTVVGEQTEPVGQAPYRYLVLDGREIHLWKPAAHLPWYRHDPWYPYWYDPYWGRRPWWW